MVRALVDLISECRGQIDRLESEFAELEKLAGGHELPRDVLQAIHHMARRQRTLGLSETQLRERLNQLQELHILPDIGSRQASARMGRGDLCFEP